MRYIFIFGVMILLVFNLQKVNAQIKRDTIYYLLDTAKVPIKDRMFRVESEGPFMFHTLDCKCFPYGYGIGFYYQIGAKKEKRISLRTFIQFKTVSITQLINLALKHLQPANRNRYHFVFAEPEGENIRLTDMEVWIPTEPRKTITETTIEPWKN